MIRRPPRSTRKESSAASDVYKRQGYGYVVTNRPLSRASPLPQLICSVHTLCVWHKTPVGAGLLAKAISKSIQIHRVHIQRPAHRSPTRHLLQNQQPTAQQSMQRRPGRGLQQQLCTISSGPGAAASIAEQLVTGSGADAEWAGGALVAGCRSCGFVLI